MNAQTTTNMMAPTANSVVIKRILTSASNISVLHNVMVHSSHLSSLVNRYITTQPISHIIQQKEPNPLTLPPPVGRRVKALYQGTMSGFNQLRVAISALPWNPDPSSLRLLVDHLPASGVCVMNDSLVYPFRLRYLGVRVTPRFCVS